MVQQLTTQRTLCIRYKYRKWRRAICRADRPGAVRAYRRPLKNAGCARFEVKMPRDDVELIRAWPAPCVNRNGTGHARAASRTARRPAPAQLQGDARDVSAGRVGAPGYDVRLSRRSRRMTGSAAAREAARSTSISATQSLCPSASTSICSTRHVAPSSDGCI